MYRSLPRTNRFLDKKWHDKNRLIHYEMLDKARPLVNTSCPQKYQHVKLKAKRHQLLEGNY